MSKNVTERELPLVLDAVEVAEQLKISKAMAYNLFKEPGFPVLKIGARLVTPRDLFIEWMYKNTNKS